MKRACKQSIRRGLTGKQRRRIARLLAEVRKNAPYGIDAIEPHQFRDARRLSDAGLAVVVESKRGWFGRRELRIFSTLDDAMRNYPRDCVIRSRR